MKGNTIYSLRVVYVLTPPVEEAKWPAFITVFPRPMSLRLFFYYLSERFAVDSNPLKQILVYYIF